MRILTSQTNDEKVQQLCETFVGTSDSAVKTRELIQRYAITDEPVLIVGESGTGKEVAAMMIHKLSSRCDNAYVAVNTGAIPENFVESEFFGVTKGAYTDAVTRNGFFSSAHQGSLFLDEIEDIPISMQNKLLRSLASQEVIPLGSSVPQKTNVRLIAASNKQPAELKIQYRPDFFYRICNLVLPIPPLRERKNDIPILLRHFSIELDNAPDFSEQALDKMMNHSWPGNIRELRGCYFRACALANTVIQPEHIQFY